MRIARTLGLGAAILALSAAPALAGGYGGRYGASYEEGAGHRSGGYSAGESYEGQRYEADGGYHAWGGGVRRSEQTSSAWTYRRIEDGGGPTCWREGDRWSWDRPGLDEPDFDGYARRTLPPCGPVEVGLPGDFFVGAGGVGGFPESWSGAGGGGFVFAGAGAHASAFASASARVSISFRGGHRGRHGGCGCGHGGHH